ncbi:N-acetyltransferase, partial [Escherichia coli]
FMLNDNDIDNIIQAIASSEPR